MGWCRGSSLKDCSGYPLTLQTTYFITKELQYREKIVGMKPINASEFRRKNTTQNVRKAKDLDGKAGSRMLYLTLGHRNGNGPRYLDMDCKRAGLIMKIRLELLTLNQKRRVLAKMP